jgi:hypothetical protein
MANKEIRMSRFIQDFGVALRGMAARPAVSLMIVGMLALGIAGNVTIFTIYSGLFLRLLPLRQADRLVNLDETAPKWNLRFVRIAKPDFDAWNEHKAPSTAWRSSTPRTLTSLAGAPPSGSKRRA